MTWLDAAYERFDLTRGLAKFVLEMPMLLPTSHASPASLLAQRVRKQPGDVALIFGPERYTWAEVGARSNQYANWLAGQGIAAGDVVALMMDNRPDFLFAVMGLSQLGAIGSLINTNLTGRALAHALRVCEPKKVLLGEDTRDR